MIKTLASRLLFVCLLTFLSAWPASAQLPAIPGTTPAAPQETADEGVGEAQRASLDDLIAILEDEATRARLIESLRAMAYQPPAADQAAAEEAEPEAASVPAALAGYTRSGVEALQMGTTAIATIVRQATNLMAGTEAINFPGVVSAILPVLAVAVAVFAAYFALSFALRPALDWLAARARPKAPILRLTLLSGAMAVSALKILLSGVAGHIAAIVFYSGPPNFAQALFLNAFVITGLIQVALSAFVAPYHPPLRMTPFSDGQARYWYKRLAFIILALGYTFLFLAPIVEANSNVRAGNAVRFIVVVITYLTTVWLIVHNRYPVAERLQRAAMHGARDFQSRVNYILGYVWWLLALVFVTALLILWLLSPRDGFQFMAVASLYSLAAITVGGLVITILSKVILSGIRVPDVTKDRLPLLEGRLNAFVPTLLTLARVIVIILVFGTILESWRIVEFSAWAQTAWGQRLVGGAIGALIILSVAFCIYVVMSSWVEYRLNPNYGTVPSPREKTLLALFRNAFTVVLAVITLMLVLSQIGLDIAPLLAGAGVVGLAIGFGAQKLVQDIITGAFIQIENVMNEGDVVQIGAISGVVEKLTIRSVSLRSLDGTYHLIPFSAADQVSNMTKDFSNFVADVEVAYREDTDEVRAAMEEAFERLRETDQAENIIGDFEFLGVEMLGSSSVLLRGRVRTLPGKQWGVGRVYKSLIKKVLDERRIEIPFPQTTVWFGTGKDGSAPPMRILRAGADSQHAEVARSLPKPKDGPSAPTTSVDDAEGADRQEAADKAEEAAIEKENPPPARP